MKKKLTAKNYVKYRYENDPICKKIIDNFKPFIKESTIISVLPAPIQIKDSNEFYYVVSFIKENTKKQSLIFFIGIDSIIAKE